MKKHIFAIAAGTFLLDLLIVLLLKPTANLFIAFAGVLLATLLFFVQALEADKDSIIGDYVAIGIAARRILPTLLLSAAVLVLQEMQIYSLPLWIHAILQALLLLITLLKLGWVRGGASVIEAKDAQIASKTARRSAWVAEVEALADKRAAFAKSLRHLARALKDSDPMSNAHSEEIEGQLENVIYRLALIEDTAELDAAIEEAEKLLRRRNEILRASK